MDSPAIDKTLPRYTAGIAVMNAGKPLVDAKPQDILHRLQTENARTVAKDLGISHVALYAWLLRNCPDDWQALSAAVQLGKITDAQDTLDDKTIDMDSVAISRTRESAKLASWQLERVSRIYAAKQEVNQGVSINVTIANPLDAKGIVVHDHSQDATTGGTLSDTGTGS